MNLRVKPFRASIDVNGQIWDTVGQIRNGKFILSLGAIFFTLPTVEASEDFAVVSEGEFFLENGYTLEISQEEPSGQYSLPGCQVCLILPRQPHTTEKRSILDDLPPMAEVNLLIPLPLKKSVSFYFTSDGTYVGSDSVAMGKLEGETRMKKWAEIFEGKEQKPGGGKLSYDFQVVYEAINNPLDAGKTGRAGVHVRYVKETLEAFRKDLEEIGMATVVFEDAERYVNHAIKRVEEFLKGETAYVTQDDAHIFWSFVEDQFQQEKIHSLHALAKEFEEEYKLHLS